MEKHTSIIAPLVILSFGCGGDVANELAESEPVQETTRLTALHEFDVQGVHYRFLDASEPGSPSVVLEQEAPMHVGGATPLAQLLDQHPDLTDLEIYLALSPDAEAPAAQLVAGHTLAASLRDRADDAVRRVDFAPRVQLDKSLANCKIIVENFLELSWSGPIGVSGMSPREQVSYSWVEATGWGKGEQATRDPVAVAICNDSQTGEPIGTRFSKNYQGTWSTLYAGDHPPDMWRAHRWGATTFFKNLRAYGEHRGRVDAFYAAGAYGFDEIE